MITVPFMSSSPLISSQSDASYFRKQVSDLYQQMKDNQNSSTPTRTLSTTASLTSLSIDISPSSSNFIEVLYIGKIKVWNKKVPDSFIDDALEKFRLHDQERRIKLHGSVETLRHDGSYRRGSVDSGCSTTDSTENLKYPPNLIRSSTISTITVKSPDVDQKPLTNIGTTTKDVKDIPASPSVSPEKVIASPSTDAQDSPEEICDNVSPSTLSRIKRVKFKTRSFSESNSMPDEVPTLSSNSSSTQNIAYASDTEASGSRYFVNIDDHNRTMVLQVGRVDLRLISPDRKVILLHKHNRDITTCTQGIINSSHFGFICREGNTLSTYIGYVFKCESQSVANEAVGAITQALTNADSKFAKPVITSCEHCPMVWYHKLCAEVEHLTDRKTQAAILRRLDQLDEEEQNTILTKFRGAETDSLREQNEFLMMLLRAHCEMKQGRHVHDSAENRSEFLNQYLGGSTIFNKARRTLTNSFDNLLKRKASRDDLAPILRDMTLPINVATREMSPHSPSSSFIDSSDRESEGFRSRSSTIGSQSDIKESRLNVKENLPKLSISPDRTISTSEKTLKSPMMDIFFKVGSNPKSSPLDEGVPKLDSGSWRQAIFKRVVTPNKQEANNAGKKRSKEELRKLWKKSIHQAILLVRMEKENAKIKAKQEENAVKRIKLEYDEMKSEQREMMDVWDLITNKETRLTLKSDNHLLLQAIRQGIPRNKRGEVWYFLAEQHCTKIPPIDSTKFPNYGIPYEKLLKQLTSHQHAILIDLGRTFPSHSYYSSPLGPGQLALFNLLKAYSLLDPEVGYCQGLSFVAGVLLLHMEESQAFALLRHLMFRRGLRKQYLPDMVGLQIKLYQLSRLLHDQLPDLYNHFDLYEVAPTLYAAPWLLTLFASQFPLGFVTRVFDLLFLENTDVIFRVALALLSLHKDSLLNCDSFEEIMNYLKNKLPAIDKVMLNKIMKEVCTTDVSKQLNEYQVEYQVLQEELASVQPQVDALHKLEAQNKTLTEQNKALMAQLELALSNVQRLEKNRTLLQATTNRLEMQSRGLEVTIATLGTFVNSLIEQKLDIEIPDDVRRILSQITFSEKRKNELRSPQNNLLKMLNNAQDKPMIKSLSTGKINLGELKVHNLTEPQNVPRSNSLSTQNAKESLQLSNTSQTSSNPNLSTKMSQFFSSSHSQILQQNKLHAQNNLSNPKIDITIQSCTDNDNIATKSTSDCSDIHKHSFQDEKSVSLPLKDKLPNYNINNNNNNNNKSSPTNSIDSGVGTPSSPREVVPHPLSNCDVQFTYNGTRELKNIKSLRNLSRNSSPDMLAK
ncbi:hypothetical protein ILUMI_07429 [Ignelater luminosus]|uniref:Rab-GAP TBC domain-containing protein n=1 Tax=Ignelater luminosus TaxID=2038154 RepID=A0A8K0D9D7_IGNLU|nr:hypothetical protein ILUMI_07429 [Ignelater luminosus]